MYQDGSNGVDGPMVSAHPMCFEHTCECLGGALCVRQANILRLVPVDVVLCCCLGLETLNIHCLYPLIFRASWTWAISFLRQSGQVTMTSARLMSVRTTDLFVSEVMVGAEV